MAYCGRVQTDLSDQNTASDDVTSSPAAAAAAVSASVDDDERDDDVSVDTGNDVSSDDDDADADDDGVEVIGEDDDDYEDDAEMTAAPPGDYHNMLLYDEQFHNLGCAMDVFKYRLQLARLILFAVLMQSMVIAVNVNALKANLTSQRITFSSPFSRLLWSPYGIGQTIKFSCCGLLFLSSFSFFSSPNLSRRRLDVCHTSTHGVALVRI